MSAPRVRPRRPDEQEADRRRDQRKADHGEHDKPDPLAQVVAERQPHLVRREVGLGDDRVGLARGGELGRREHLGHEPAAADPLHLGGVDRDARVGALARMQHEVERDVVRRDRDRSDAVGPVVHRIREHGQIARPPLGRRGLRAHRRCGERPCQAGMVAARRLGHEHAQKRPDLAQLLRRDGGRRRGLRGGRGGQHPRHRRQRDHPPSHAHRVPHPLADRPVVSRRLRPRHGSRARRRGR